MEPETLELVFNFCIKRLIQCSSKLGESVYTSSIDKFNYINKLDITHPTFDHRNGFYTLSKLNKSIIIDNFILYRNYEMEKTKYTHFINEYGGKYILVHHHQGMILPKDIPVVFLNNKSNNILDMLMIIENAIELHIYDSLYGVLIYLCYFSLGCLFT